MHTMEQDLNGLVQKGMVDADDAEFEANIMGSITHQRGKSYT